MARLTPASRAPGGPARERLASIPALVPVLVALAVVLLTQYGGALSIPFINDDYVFLDRTRAASFGSLWGFGALAFHWYRPVSRELHYWVLQRLFGPHEIPFHLVSLALWLAVLALYFVLVRRLAGLGAAAVATAGLAALAAWGVPVLWVAGVQDLWMLFFVLLALLGIVRGSATMAFLSSALALLSKETAVVLPALAFAAGWIARGDRPAQALRRAGPIAFLTAAWAAVHPLLGGRLIHPLSETPPAGIHPAAAAIAVRTLLVPFNLDAAPAPESGWGAGLLRALPAVLALVLLVAWCMRPRANAMDAEDLVPPSRTATFGAVWAALAWAPLFVPSLGWHAYYALLGAGGAWLGIGTLLARHRMPALLLIAALALLRGARADTPSRDWGTEWYQRRAGAFLSSMRADLRRVLPQPPPHARLYFVRVPSNVGFLAGDGPALRVWYGDSSLRAAYYPVYRPRRAGEPAGPDFFFRYDSTTGWVPIVHGPEDIGAARLANPRWLHDHEVLARRLADAGDWQGAAIEFEKLAAADSSRADHAFNAAVSHENAGDSTAAAGWYARAARLPGADAEMKAAAERFRDLRRHR